MTLRKSPDAILRRVTARSSPLFAPSLEILFAAIPASEQLSVQKLLKLFARDDYCMYALLVHETVGGMAILYLPETQPFVLLDYMAVRADLRGQGLGSTLFREIVKMIGQERPSAHYLIFEVDDDRNGLEELRSINRRRIEFYRRLGAQVLANAPYLFPSPSGPAVPMRLMVYRLHPGADLSQKDIQSAIENIFQEIHDRDKNDHLLRSIVDRLPSQLILE